MDSVIIILEIWKRDIFPLYIFLRIEKVLNFLRCHHSEFLNRDPVGMVSAHDQI